jgi:hypothetical protein
MNNFLIKEHHDAILRKKSDWTFFLGIADYIAYCKRNKKLNIILGNVIKERENILRNRDKQGKKFLSKIQKVYKKTVVLKPKTLQKLGKSKAFFFQ